MRDLSALRTISSPAGLPELGPAPAAGPIPYTPAAAPAAIGTYSQAIEAGGLVFLSGQIPLVPATMEIVAGDFEARARQVFDNLRAVALHGLRTSNK